MAKTHYALNPLSLIFGSAQRKSRMWPATLGKALSRQYLIYPLASFDISGQQPVFVQTPHANEEWLAFTELHSSCQEKSYGEKYSAAIASIFDPDTKIDS